LLLCSLRLQAAREDERERRERRERERERERERLIVCAADGSPRL
jgi:hypothetical protein